MDIIKHQPTSLSAALVKQIRYYIPVHNKNTRAPSHTKLPLKNDTHPSKIAR